MEPTSTNSRPSLPEPLSKGLRQLLPIYAGLAQQPGVDLSSYDFSSMVGMSSEEVERLQAEADQLLDSESYEEALPRFALLSALKPEDQNQQFLAAVCMQRAGHPTYALPIFTALAAGSCGVAAAAYRLGECHLELNQQVEAKRAFQLCINEATQSAEDQELSTWATEAMALCHATT